VEEAFKLVMSAGLVVPERSPLEDASDPDDPAEPAAPEEVLPASSRAAAK